MGQCFVKSVSLKGVWKCGKNGVQGLKRRKRKCLMSICENKIKARQITAANHAINCENFNFGGK